MITVRGAITIENNTESEIIDATKTLLSEIISKNKIDTEDIVFIMFTATKDIDKAYPAVGARLLGITDASLICAQEMYVVGSLPKCIRVMLAANSNLSKSEIIHCYMENAKILRPDLAKPVYSVAIDGPTASGKSTLAKEVASRLNIAYADTGAMYRAIALYFKNKDIDLNSEEQVSAAVNNVLLTIKYENGNQLVYIDGEDVTDIIRSAEIAELSSQVAAIKEVRDKLTEFQRSLAVKQSIVMDGRDIGTLVLPDSTAKFFITASIDERAKRRCIDYEKKGIYSSFESVRKQIAQRDYQDSTREIAPLLKAEDAYEIDTTEMNFSQVAEKIIGIVNERLEHGKT